LTAARRVLLIGGIALAVVGMCHGTWYAVFAEHQALDRIGASLASAFTRAAEQDPAQMKASISNYREAKYVYERQVDAHGHWIGLAMLLIVMGAIFDHVAFGERVKLWIAIALLAGAVVFPLGVVLQTLNDGGTFASALAILGSTLTIVALAASAWGLTTKDL